MERPDQQKALSEEQEQQEQKLRSARAEAHGAIRAHAATQERQRTSAENPNFVGDFFAASRLHFIGSWKMRFEDLLNTLPPPPPLPPVPAGGERTILHVDMDCFFASVAARNRPALQGLPLAVSWSDNEHGAAEIASANCASPGSNPRLAEGLGQVCYPRSATLMLEPCLGQTRRERAACATACGSRRRSRGARSC